MCALVNVGDNVQALRLESNAYCLYTGVMKGEVALAHNERTCLYSPSSIHLRNMPSMMSRKRGSIFPSAPEGSSVRREM